MPRRLRRRQFENVELEQRRGEWLVSNGKPQVWIQGSCVTRDAIQHVLHEIVIKRYRARSSIISLVSRSVEPPDLNESGTNRFEFQNVLADFTKSWVNDMEEFGGYKIFDFIDERFGVIDAGGKYFTLSTNLRAVASRENIAKIGRYIPPHSEEYYELVNAAIEKFVHIVSSDRKVFALKAYWATETETGCGFQQFGQDTISRMNTVLDRIYDGLRRAGMNFIEIPQTDFIAADQHKWGAAPFHYIESTERALAAAILAAVTGARR